MGDLVGIYDGVHQTPDYQDSGIMFLSVENIATLKSEKYISEEAFERDYNVYPEKGDILMTRIGDVGTTNVVETAEKVAFYVSLALLKPNGIDSYFLSNAMKTNDFQKGLRERTLVTAIPQKINKDEIGKINIFITNNDEEQKKIGAYFSSLDHLITLHQRKNIYFYEKVTLVWEQRKLGKLVDRVTRKNQDLVSELPLTISAQYGLIDQNEFFDKRVASKDVSGYYLIENGEFAYNKSTSTDAPWGAVKRLDRYENGVLSTLYIVFGIKENNPVDSDFLVSYYSTNLWHKGIHEIAAEGARNHGLLNIAPADFFETELTMPQDIEEQKKIGKYFEELERLITLHQCKCHLLLKLLHNDWEQRKLGKLVDRVTRKNQDLVSELPLTISAQYGLIDQNEFFDKRVASKDVSGYYLIENGEFAYNKSTSTDAPWGAVKRLDRYENGVLSTLYIVFGIKENNPVDSDFLVSYYSTNLWHKGIHEIAAEGARNHGLLNIAPADFFETELTMPQDIEEQKKIGKYFEELERLITLHHRKYIYILKSP